MALRINHMQLRMIGIVAAIEACSFLVGCQTPPRVHPYLFFGTEDLPTIRERVKEHPASFFGEHFKGATRERLMRMVGLRCGVRTVDREWAAI